MDKSPSLVPLHGGALLFVEAAKLRQKLGRPLTQGELDELRQAISNEERYQQPKGFDLKIKKDRKRRRTLNIFAALILTSIFMIMHILFGK